MIPFAPALPSRATTVQKLDTPREVDALFERLTAEVVRFGGTVKEYQGDAIFAFWEGPAAGRQAVAAWSSARG